MAHVLLPSPSDFSLQAAQRFVQGFAPGSGMAAARADRLTLVFRLDGTFAPGGAVVTQSGEQLRVDLFGEVDPKVAAAQVARTLGVDVPAPGWLELGQREALVGTLQRALPGLRPVSFPSPYEAGAWGILSQRLPMIRAAAFKTQLAEKHGDALEIEGIHYKVFPSPEALLRVRALPSLPEEKLRRLHALATAALEGKLDAHELKSLPMGEALARLRKIHGVGEWTASLILMRGTGLTDAAPSVEPRVLEAYAQVTGKPAPSREHFDRLARQWSPFGMWVSFLLVNAAGRMPQTKKGRLSTRMASEAMR